MIPLISTIITLVTLFTQQMSFMVELVLVIIAGFDILAYFIIKQGDNYGPERTSKEADEYGGIVSESKGPVTVFLYLCIITLLIWAVVYLYLNAWQFANLFY